MCGDMVQFLCVGFAHHIINFRLVSLILHAWVFTQIFVKGHIGQMFNVPFDVTMSVRDVTMSVTDVTISERDVAMSLRVRLLMRNMELVHLRSSSKVSYFAMILYGVEQ